MGATLRSQVYKWARQGAGRSRRDEHTMIPRNDPHDLLFKKRANILGFNGVVHSVEGDVFVDNETSVVTSSISRICRLGL